MLDRLLPKIDTLLSPDGVFYLVIIKENDIGKLDKDSCEKCLDKAPCYTDVMHYYTSISYRVT